MSAELVRKWLSEPPLASLPHILATSSNVEDSHASRECTECNTHNRDMLSIVLMVSRVTHRGPSIRGISASY